MPSLYISAINAQTDEGKSTRTHHEGSRLSCNNSSVFLRNFKDTNTKSIMQRLSKTMAPKPKKSRINIKEMHKSSVFNRLYHHAGIKHKQKGNFGRNYY
jgi:hypothetical protein